MWVSSARSSSRRRRDKTKDDPLGRAKTNIPPEDQPPHADAVFVEAAAARATHFVEEYCRHSRGELGGQKFTLVPWERAMVRAIFGWLRKSTGRRWYRRADLWIPRKNGKSTFAAALALYLLFADNELAAEVYLVANDKSQTKQVFQEAKYSTQTDPTLAEMSQIFDSARTKSILVPETMSSLEALSSDPKNKDGKSISGCVFDEIHELRDRELWKKMRTGGGARTQPLLIAISTAGHDRNTVGWEEYQIDKRIVAGKSGIQDRLVIIFEADPDDDWKSEDTWRKANPMYDLMESCRSQIRSVFAEALEKASDEAAFKRYHLNLWTGAKTSAFNLDKWDACDEKFSPANLMGLPAWIGVDLSKRSDITAAVLLFRKEIDSQAHYFAVPRFWLPEDEIDLKERRDGVQYREWARAGYLVLTPGNVVDYDFILSQILEWQRAYNPREVAYDPYNATQFANQLLAAGVTAVEFAQHIRNVNAPTKELMNLVLCRRFHHGGNPILRWMAENAASIRDVNDNEKLTKSKSTGRIDGLSATINALGRASLDKSQPSVYEQRGVLTP